MGEFLSFNVITNQSIILEFETIIGHSLFSVPLDYQVLTDKTRVQYIFGTVTYVFHRCIVEYSGW